jgi:cytoskeletal protein CcmA (bactofilin family)
MSFFKDFKNDLSQALSELIPGDDAVEDIDEPIVNTLDEVKDTLDEATENEKMKEWLEDFAMEDADNSDEAIRELLGFPDKSETRKAKGSKFRIKGNKGKNDKSYTGQSDVRDTELSVESAEQYSAEQLTTEQYLTEQYSTEQFSDTEQTVDSIPEQLGDILAEQFEEAMAEQSEETMAEQFEEAMAEQSEETMAELPEDIIAEQSEETMAEQSEETMAEQSEETMAELPEDIMAEQSEEAMAEQSEETMTEQFEETIAKQSEDIMTEQSEDTMAEQPEDIMADQTEEPLFIQASMFEDENFPEAGTEQPDEIKSLADAKPVYEETGEPFTEYTQDAAASLDETPVEAGRNEATGQDNQIIDVYVEVSEDMSAEEILNNEGEDMGENMDDNIDLELLNALSADDDENAEDISDSESVKEEPRLKAASVANEDEVTVISKGTTINGNISSDGSLDIMGTVTGDIECLGKLSITGKVSGNSTAAEIYVNTDRIEGGLNSEGSVKVGLGTVVIGDITATSGVIAGAVKGEIDINGPIVIDSTAIIKGNIKAKSMQINNGAVIEGFCSLSYAAVDVDNIFE